MVQRAVTAEPVRLRYYQGHIEAELTDSQRGNPLGPGLVDGLLAALDTAENTPSCVALLISGTGPHFCSGLDLNDIPDGWLSTPADMPTWRLFNRLRTAAVATVALVDGQATGGGVALAGACDLVIAGEAATFRFTEVLLGLIPATALPFVANRVGGQHAFRMAITAAEVDAREAARIGLADMVHPRAADGVRPLLLGLRRQAPGTLQAMKRLRSELFPQPPWLGEAAGRAFADRFADPTVAARLDQLRAAGALR
jgi:polyketide biosynthesis enoyl-CoA hydratase PksH